MDMKKMNYLMACAGENQIAEFPHWIFNNCPKRWTLIMLLQQQHKIIFKVCNNHWLILYSYNKSYYIRSQARIKTNWHNYREKKYHQHISVTELPAKLGNFHYRDLLTQIVLIGNLFTTKRQPIAWMLLKPKRLLSSQKVKSAQLLHKTFTKKINKHNINSMATSKDHN